MVASTQFIFPPVMGKKHVLTIVHLKALRITGIHLFTQQECFWKTVCINKQTIKTVKETLLGVLKEIPTG